MNPADNAATNGAGPEQPTTDNIHPTGNTNGPTNGQKAVGLTFNPSGDPAVRDVKLAFAKVIDTLEAATDLNSPVHRKLRDAAIHEAISAQMWAVKVLTWSNK